MRDYTALVTPQHCKAERFIALLRTLTQPLAETAQQALTLHLAFSLDQATGVQLDTLGAWIGLSRYVKTPIKGVYFALDTEAVGLDEGSWKRAYDADSGFTELDDETYRTILRTKIIANHWDGTNEALAQIYQRVVPDGNVLIFFRDNQDMSMDIYLTGGVIPEVVKAVIRQGYLNVKPATVNVTNYINSENNTPLFGLDADNPFMSGFDSGGWPVKL